MISPATAFSSKDEGVTKIVLSRRLSEDLDRLMRRGSNPDAPYMQSDDSNSNPSTTTSNVIPMFGVDTPTHTAEDEPTTDLFEKLPVQARSISRYMSDESKHSLESDKQPSPGETPLKQSFLSVSLANQRSKSRSPDGSFEGTHSRGTSMGSDGGRNKLRVVIMELGWQQFFELELRGRPTVEQTIEQIIVEFRVSGQETDNVLSGWRSDQYDLWMVDEDDDIADEFPALLRTADFFGMELDGVALVLRDAVKREMTKLATDRSAPPSPNHNHAHNPNFLSEAGHPGIHHAGHGGSSSISSFDVGESVHSSFLNGHASHVGPGPANWTYKEYVVTDLYDSKKPQCRLGIDKDRILNCVSKKNKSYHGAVSAMSMLPHWVYVFLSEESLREDVASDEVMNPTKTLFGVEQFLNEREQMQHEDPDSTSPSKSPQQSPGVSPAPTPEPPTLIDQEIWDARLDVILREDERLESMNDAMLETHKNNRWIDANVVEKQRDYLLRKLVERSSLKQSRPKVKTPTSDQFERRRDSTAIDPGLVRQTSLGRPRKASMFSFSIGWSSRMHARRDSQTRSSRTSSNGSSTSSASTGSVNGRRRSSSISIFQPLTIEGLDKVSVSKTDTRIFELTFILYENEYEFAGDGSEDETKMRDDSANRSGAMSRAQLNMIWDIPSGESRDGFDTIRAPTNLKKSMSTRQLIHAQSMGGSFETHSCRYRAQSDEDCAEIVSRIGHLMYIERVEEEKQHHFFVNSKRHLEQLRRRLVAQYKLDKKQLMNGSLGHHRPQTSMYNGQQIGFRTMDDSGLDAGFSPRHEHERLYLRIDTST